MQPNHITIKTARNFGMWVTLLFLTLCAGGIAFRGAGEQSREGGVTPSNGFVPDGRTAVKIAEAVIEPVFGASCLTNERPFKARLIGGVWRVTGYEPITNEWMGGVAEVHIDKTNGCILLLTHGK
ncbi:MAG TPA: NTF2 fold immunity protein [Clostridia bacterium]|nr:NTF2 fold immunity protein [Clostridia bacterium]